MLKWIRPAAIILATGLFATASFAQPAASAQQTVQVAHSAHGHSRARTGPRHARPRAQRSFKRRHARPHYRANRHRARRGQHWQRSHRPGLQQRHNARKPAWRGRPHPRRS